MMIQETLSLIEQARLPHPSGPLLAAFVTEALQPLTAANFVKLRCRDAADERAALQSLVSDWTYIVEACESSPLPLQCAHWTGTIQSSEADRLRQFRHSGRRHQHLTSTHDKPSSKGTVDAVVSQADVAAGWIRS